MKTIKEINNSSEMITLIDRANYIKSFGGVFEYRFNRNQEDKTIRLTKYNKDDDNEIDNVRNFEKISDLYIFLNKGSRDINYDDDLFDKVKKIPNE
jgi:hypothetical protein